MLRQLCGAIHWHQPVYPQQTGTDSEEPGLILRDDGRLSAVPKMTEMAQACGWCSAAEPFSPESWPHAAELSPRPEKGNDNVACYKCLTQDWRHVWILVDCCQQCRKHIVACRWRHHVFVESMSDFKLKLSLEQVLSHWINMSGTVRVSLSFWLGGMWCCAVRMQ